VRPAPGRAKRAKTGGENSKGAEPAGGDAGGRGVGSRPMRETRKKKGGEGDPQRVEKRNAATLRLHVSEVKTGGPVKKRKLREWDKGASTNREGDCHGSRLVVACSLVTQGNDQGRFWAFLWTFGLWFPFFVFGRVSLSEWDYYLGPSAMEERWQSLGKGSERKRKRRADETVR